MSARHSPYACSRGTACSLAPRAGEVDVFAAVGKSFARLALRAGPRPLEARVKEELARRKSCVCLIS